MTTKSPPARHERKQQLSPTEDLLLAARLRKLFRHDSHAGADGSYRVCSLYFDSPYDEALRDKLEGLRDREKFRLRYYGADFSFVRLEKKVKRGALCRKHSARLQPDEVQSLLAGEYRFLLESGTPLLQELYSKLQGACLRPRTVVCYDREAFSYAPGNVRVTLDRNMRGGLSSVDFLNPKLQTLPALEGSTILEVKYDRFLPDVVRLAVQVPNRQSAAFSKYALCRRFD